MWKVRFLNADGDLAEAEFSGTLTEIDAHDFGGPVIVVQRSVPAAAGPGDSAKGGDAVAVAKT